MVRDAVRGFGVAFVLALAMACGGGGGGKDAGVDTGDPGGLPDIVYTDEGGDRGDTGPEVPACVDDCTSVGDSRCTAGVEGLYEICALGEDGCLHWGLSQACPVGQPCVAGQCTASCQSDPGCTAAGDKRCGSATGFQSCVESAPGCFTWGTEQACAGAGICAGAGTCQCQHACDAVGDRKCFGAEPNLYLACAEDVAGCRVWGTPVACEGDAVCKGAGVCEAVCTSDCTKEGDVRCASGTTYQVCMTVQPGCLKWGDAAACPGTLTCTGGQCQVECVADADCDAVGKVGCSEDGLERTCEEVLPGCRKWGSPRACPLHQACVTGGCACTSPCGAGAAECIPEVDVQYRKACGTDAAGCTFWAYEDCGGGAACDAGACVELCGSDPGCTAAGVTRCESLGSFSTCAEVPDHAGCIQFGAAAACPAHQDCQDVTGACACRVEEGCTAVGTKRCVDYDNAATCRQDAATACFYWGAPEACPEGTTCNGGTCTAICVSDLDCPTAGYSRCTAEGQLQTCVEVETGCIKWAPTQDCPPRQACADGQGCLCVDPCKAGESRCVGLSQRQTCDSPDELGCTAWSSPATCAEGESCVKGACKVVRSPVVDCGRITLNLVNQGYSEVSVSGSFQGLPWVTLPLVLTEGVWSATVDVAAPGRYEYKFVADGTWVRDPLNAAVSGTPPLDNSVVDVTGIRTCDTVGASRCTAEGALETCTDVRGCAAWKPAADPCTAADRYCDAGACHPIVSPVATVADVTFTVRDQGFPVEVSGDFASPAWGAYFPMESLPGHRTVTLKVADVPGLTVGKHAYKFHAPAAGTWFFDPANPAREDDGTGGFNSIVIVPRECVPGCDTPGDVRCKDAGTQQQCGPDAFGCNAWIDGACPANQQCLRQSCEPEPVVDGTGKTATFVVVDDGAASFAVAGDFTTTAWDLGQAVTLVKSGNLWVGTTAALASGTYRYKLVRDGAAWQADPRNPVREDDGMGGQNNLFTIP
jgi:hypothetical protein